MGHLIYAARGTSLAEAALCLLALGVLLAGNIAWETRGAAIGWLERRGVAGRSVAAYLLRRRWIVSLLYSERVQKVAEVEGDGKRDTGDNEQSQTDHAATQR